MEQVHVNTHGTICRVALLAGNSQLTFIVGDQFSKGLANQEKLANGETVGDMHARTMHEYLQEWIDANKGAPNAQVK